MSCSIRREYKGDYAAIRQVIERAFQGKPYADGNEHEIVDKLRQHNALTLSLVAECDGMLTGQIAFSPATTSDGTKDWYTLGPLAVVPEYQHMGIGSRLVKAGLEAIAELGAGGCIVVGDPGYYTRLGFELAPSSASCPEFRQHFMLKRFGGPLPKGPIGFHSVFDTPVR